MLRLAEFLERGRNAAVDDVIVTWDDDELRLTLVEARLGGEALLEAALGESALIWAAR